MMKQMVLQRIAIGFATLMGKSVTRVQRGFDFLGYRLSPQGITVAEATWGRFCERALRLYERDRREPSGLRLGAQGWVRAAHASLTPRRANDPKVQSLSATDRPHIVAEALAEEVDVATAEVHPPSVDGIVLGSRPIDVRLHVDERATNVSAGTCAVA